MGQLTLSVDTKALIAVSSILSFVTTAVNLACRLFNASSSSLTYMEINGFK